MSNARQIEAQAAQWITRRDGEEWSVADQEELDRWLGSSLANKAAFWRLEEGWERADRISALGLPPQYEGSFHSRFEKTWKPLAMAASLALVSLVGVTQLGIFGQPGAPHGQQIATPIGGHKVVQLSDGSSIEVNTASLLRAAVTDRSREVWLEKGEAFFDVQHSDTIPFVVHAGPKTVTVLGTKFSVRREGDKVIVAVLQGRVRVAEARGAEQSSATLVPAGSIAVTETNSTLVTEEAPTTIQAELAWRDGQLIFRNDTLAEAAAEFNRYNDRKLVVTGKAAQLKIGGSFKASNVDGFSRLLRDAYGLNVTSADDKVVVTE
jgi:transmembrane sensor